uniref:Uncharacterized protein n=1 Tax=Moniliophthora roreri TaxID=221103 RepID=A0A0W0FSU6_MONRR
MAPSEAMTTTWHAPKARGQARYSTSALSSLRPYPPYHLSCSAIRGFKTSLNRMFNTTTFGIRI